MDQSSNSTNSNSFATSDNYCLTSSSSSDNSSSSEARVINQQRETVHSKPPPISSQPTSTTSSTCPTDNAIPVTTTQAVDGSLLDEVLSDKKLVSNLNAAEECPSIC